jgi:hypothetical protein
VTDAPARGVKAHPITPGLEWDVCRPFKRSPHAAGLLTHRHAVTMTRIRVRLPRPFRASPLACRSDRSSGWASHWHRHTGVARLAVTGRRAEPVPSGSIAPLVTAAAADPDVEMAATGASHIGLKPRRVGQRRPGIARLAWPGCPLRCWGRPGLADHHTRWPPVVPQARRQGRLAARSDGRDAGRSCKGLSDL